MLGACRYTLVLELRDAEGHLVDCEACHVGVRRVTMVGGRLHLNGQPLVIRGVNRHEHCPLRGKAVDWPSMLMDLKLMKAHSLAEQLPDKERSSTWTIKLPAAELFETGIFSEPLAEVWGKPALHRWEPTILSRREDGKKFLAQVVAARHAGMSLLLFGLTPSAEGMYLTAEVQAPQEGVAPPYVWQSRVLGTDALKADASAADEARLLRRCVAFPEAAAEFCRDVG